jgi:hypothetical protein
MLLDQNCPLYRAGGHYPLHAIDVAHWTPFVEQRFAGAQKHITAEQIGSVCHLTDGHPFYTQHLFHIIWELCEPQTNVTEELIKSAVELLLDRENYAYTSLWESFTVNQRRFLKGISLESSDVKPFSGEFIQRYGLRSPSNVQRVADKLLESDVIDRDKGRFVISDRFLKIWLHRHA